MAIGGSTWTDGYWWSGDGLRLHFRDYAGSSDRPPILCVPGLTRNARDFERLAPALAGARRVLCPDMRGRGDSAWSPNSASYNPMQYIADVGAMCDSLGIGRAVVIGTSLGGLMALLQAMLNPGQLAGVVLNDIGPVIDPEGLERIRDYVGQARSFPTWMHAARALEEAQARFFPAFTIDDWLVMAKRALTLGDNGRIVFDYDMKIAEPFAKPGGEAGVDLWPGVRALAGKPVLVVRGALSDLFSAQTLAAMLAELPGASAVTVPQVGHAPTLDEPEAVAAIQALLARVA